MSAYISACQYAIAGGVTNNFGFRFTTREYSSTNRFIPDNFSHYHDTTIIEDSVNWVKISGTFVADSAYSFMLIGNFYDDAHTKSKNIMNNHAYYYIDSINVYEIISNENGIESMNNNIPHQLFPNPFTNQFELTLYNNEPCELTLYDITSKKVLKQTFSGSAQINTDELSKGVYIYEIRTQNNIQSGKIVKQ